MTVWRQRGYDFKHVEWGAKVCFDLYASEGTNSGLVVRALDNAHEVLSYHLFKIQICALECTDHSDT